MNKKVNSWIIGAGTMCALGYGLIVWMSYGLPAAVCEALDRWTFHRFSTTLLELQNGFYYDTANNDMPTGPYLFCFFIVFGIVAAVIGMIKRTAYHRSTLMWIAGFAIVFRLIVFSSVLIHENDIYRYMWDGHATLAGVNPYKYAPFEVFEFENIEEEAIDFGFIPDAVYHDVDHAAYTELKTLTELKQTYATTYTRIGHWEVPTIYPPVAQAIFAAAMAIKSDSIHFMRFVFVLFDIGCFFWIVAILKHLKMNSLMSVVYGWMPVVVIQLNLSGHYDAVVIFFMLAAIYLYLAQRLRLSCVALALATLSKFFPVVLFPILYRQKWFSQGLFFSGLIFIFYLPYFIWDQTGVAGVFEGLMTYNKEWSYSASIFDVVYYTLEAISTDFVTTLMPAKMIVGVMYLLLFVVCCLERWRDNVSDKMVVFLCFCLIAGLFIINPVADPWYYCWVIPFLCVFPYRSWLLLSGLLMLSYLNFHSDIAWIDGRFLNIKLLQWVIYVPFYLLFGYEWGVKKRRWVE